MVTLHVIVMAVSYERQPASYWVELEDGSVTPIEKLEPQPG